jgi:hypothetical protein
MFADSYMDSPSVVQRLFHSDWLLGTRHQLDTDVVERTSVSGFKFTINALICKDLFFFYSCKIDWRNNV